MKKRKLIKNLIFVAAAFLLVAVMVYSGFHIVESFMVPAELVEASSSSKTITRNGVDYFPRQDITTILVMGVDQYGPVEDSGSYQNPGAADMVMLLIFDEAAEVCNILQLNRDTMLDMPVLGLGGRKAGTWYGQLAMSHTYGNGLKDSCENTRQTVSDMLYGLYIDYYIAMNMDAISIANDAVGGVPVTVTEDFSRVDPSIGMGAVTLMGDQALNYVRTRKDIGDQLNLSRIQRQKDYITSFAQRLRADQDANSGFVVSVYEQLEPYIVTDCSVNAINGIINHYGDYTIGRVDSPEGANVLGEEYYEFYVDEESLDALILELFYAPKG